MDSFTSIPNTKKKLEQAQSLIYTEMLDVESNAEAGLAWITGGVHTLRCLFCCLFQCFTNARSPQQLSAHHHLCLYDHSYRQCLCHP